MRTRSEMTLVQKLIWQLVWFLTRELDPGTNKRAASDWKLVGPRIRNLLRVIHSICPSLEHQMAVEKREIGKALVGLGLHGLVNFGDRNLIEVGEAIKNELMNHYHTVKSLSQRVEKLVHIHSQTTHVIQINGKDIGAGTYAINDKKGPVPSQSSHQRLMNLKLTEIKGRLERNECMLQTVQACLHNGNLESLERILQKRIRYDRDILTQFAYLTRRNSTYTLASEDPVVSHVLVLFSKGYERLLKMIPVAGNSGDEEMEYSSSSTSGQIEINGKTITINDNGEQENGQSSAVVTDSGTEVAVLDAGYAATQNLLCWGIGNGETRGAIRFNQNEEPRRNRERDGDCRHRKYNRSSSVAIGGMEGNGERSSRRVGHYAQSRTPHCATPSPPSNAWSSMESLQCIGNGDRVFSYTSLPCLNGWPQMHKNIDGLLAPVGQLQITNGNGYAPNVSPPDDDIMDNRNKTELIQLRLEVARLRAALISVHDRLKKQRQQHDTQALLNSSSSSSSSRSQCEFSSHAYVTDLIDQYGLLYTKDRVETIKELDGLPELRGAEELQTKILLSVIVLSFRFVWLDIYKTKDDVMKVLRENKAVRDAEQDSSNPVASLLQNLNNYLLEKAKMDNYERTAKQVGDQLWSTLYDFAILKSCGRLKEFIMDCASTAWRLSTTQPAHTIQFDDSEFDHNYHTRTHSSKLHSKRINRFIWPALVEANTGKVAYRAVVVT